MNYHIDMLGASYGNEGKRWADVVVNLAEKGVTIPQLPLASSNG
jgi:hypothetical protein